MSGNNASPASAVSLYRPVDTLPDDKKAHRRFWDRERQREHRAKSKRKVLQLETETKSLGERLKVVEEERDAAIQTVVARDKRIEELDAIIKRQSAALQAILSSAQNATSGLDSDVCMTGPPGTNAIVQLPANVNISREHDHSHASPPRIASTDWLFPLPSHDTVDSIAWANFVDSWPLNLIDSLPLPDEAVLRQHSADITPAWERLPVNSPPMCKHDEAVYELLQRFQDAETRAAEASAEPSTEPRCCEMDRRSDGLQKTRYIAELSTPTFPQVSSLLNPPVQENSNGNNHDSHRSQSHIVSRGTRKVKGRRRPHRGIAHTIFARVMTQMPVEDVAGRLAAMWLVCHQVRWRLCRSEPTFKAMPSFLRPTTTQLTVPHPMWIDTIVWPAARNRLIENSHIYRDGATFDVFRTRLGQALSVNWDRNLLDSLAVVPLVDSEADGNGAADGDATHDGLPRSDYCLSQLFQDHLSDIANWSLDEAFVAAYPFLRGAVNESKRASAG